MDKPSKHRGIGNVNTKYAISAISIIAIVIAAVFIYAFYQGQNQTELQPFQNLIDDTGYTTSLSLSLTELFRTQHNRNRICFS
jgi:hypothetical protein